MGDRPSQLKMEEEEEPQDNEDPIAGSSTVRGQAIYQIVTKRKALAGYKAPTMRQAPTECQQDPTECKPPTKPKASTECKPPTKPKASTECKPPTKPKASTECKPPTKPKASTKCKPSTKPKASTECKPPTKPKASTECKPPTKPKASTECKAPTKHKASTECKAPAKRKPPTECKAPTKCKRPTKWKAPTEDLKVLTEECKAWTDEEEEEEEKEAQWKAPPSPPPPPTTTTTTASEEGGGANAPTPQCTLCQGDLATPKLMPCAHPACLICIKYHLEKKASQPCPSCRIPLLPFTPTTHPPSQVQPPPPQRDNNNPDNWPPDLMSEALMTARKALKGPHACSVCGPDKPALAEHYCAECSCKLCSSCATYHKKLPATESHTLKDVDRLTAQEIQQGLLQARCQEHPGNKARVYCHRHKRLVCEDCRSGAGGGGHARCPDLKPMPEAAKKVRKELEGEVKRLNRNKKLTDKIKLTKKHFKGIRQEAGQYCNDLIAAVKKLNNDLNALIDKEEDKLLTPLAQLESIRKANAAYAERLVTSAADDVLLGMQGEMAGRLTTVDEQIETQWVKFKDLKLLQFLKKAEKVIPPVGKLATFSEEAPRKTLPKGNGTDEGKEPQGSCPPPPPKTGGKQP